MNDSERSRDVQLCSPAFQHSALTYPEDELRLFELQPPFGQNVIRLRLKTWLFEKCPEYTAISYVWGDHNAKSSISVEVNGKPLELNNNAIYALEQVRQLRSDSIRTKHFWMDVVCIDQSNLDEKGHQVRLMGRIFETAVEVCACVGPREDHSEVVIDVFHNFKVLEVLHGIRKASEESGERSISVSQKLATALTSTVQACWERSASVDPARELLAEFESAVTYFCNREYWRRIWIVQEVRLAKGVKLVCGSDHLDISDLTPFFDLSALVTAEKGLNWIRSWTQSSLGKVLSGRRASSSTQYIARHAFRDLRESHCTDFRDRVYALLRVMSWDDSDHAIKIKPDYQITEYGLMSQVLEDMMFAGCSGSSAWSTLRELYDALQLTADDPHIGDLLNQRRGSLVGETQDEPVSNASGPNKTGFMYKCKSGFGMSTGYQLITDMDGFKIQCCWSRPFRHTRKCLAESSVLTTHCKPVRVDGQLVGWVCPHAQEGDYLVPVVLNVDDPIGTPDMVVSRDMERRGVHDFRLIGHAVLYHEIARANSMPYVQPPEPTIVPISLILWFDFDDLIGLVALRRNATRGDFTPADLAKLLSMSPTSRDLSSYAVDGM